MHIVYSLKTHWIT